jgi:O-antigen chain-terminating methyltransferase
LLVSQVSPDPLVEAAQHVDLGLPLPPKTRFRFFKQILLRILRLTGHRQVAFNHQVLLLLEQLANQPGSPPTLPQVLAEELAALRSDIAQLARVDAELEVHAADVDARLEGVANRSQSLVQSIANLEARADAIAAELALEHRRQRLRASVAATRSRARWSEPDELVAQTSPGDAHPELMVALHEALRGPTDEVRRRLSVYLEPFEAARHGRVLDIGSGRGEWLELLNEAGFDAYGIECNRVFVENGQARGHNVLEAEALSHLSKLPDHSLAAVSAFHVIEHMPFATLVDVLDEILRVLEPGGLLTVETPNVANLAVGAASFHLDPTHVLPIHPSLLETLFDAQGYVDVKLEYLHPGAAPLPPPPSGRNPTAAVVAYLNEQFFTPADLSALARRPTD